jgi:hypothetical protein
VTLKQLQEEILPEKLNEKLEGFERSHFFDQREFGKVLIVVSLSMLIFSVFSLTQINDTVETTSTLQSEFSELSAVMSTPQFNSSLSAIEDLETSSIGQDFGLAAQTFRALQERVNAFNAVNSELGTLQKTYQWMVLISILGLAAGITVIYI